MKSSLSEPSLNYNLSTLLLLHYYFELDLYQIVLSKEPFYSSINCKYSILLTLYSAGFDDERMSLKKYYSHCYIFCYKKDFS